MNSHHSASTPPASRAFRLLQAGFLLLGLIAGLTGCATKEPLVLLKPSQDMHMATPPGARPTTVARAQPFERTAGPQVVIETNLGKVVISLNEERAPITVSNFLQYVREGFYANTLFHRVIPGFMIQGGGFSIAMEEKATRAAIRNESTNGLKNLRGSIAMARRAPLDSATAQFFINLADNPFLDADGPYGGYAVFGFVSEGMETVDRIAAVATETRGSLENVPVQPVIIRSITIR